MLVFNLIASISILSSASAASLIGLFRYKQTLKTYHPFIFYTWLALTHLALGYLLQNNLLSNNIFSLIEFLLLIWLLKNLAIWQSKKLYYTICTLAITLLWIVDTFLINVPTEHSPLYRMAYSFILILFGIDHFAYTLITEKKNILSNPHFLVSTGIIIFFSFNCFAGFYYLFELNVDENIFESMSVIRNSAILTVNLIFALAMLWIPKKQDYISF